jgi:hypothetical protein
MAVPNTLACNDTATITAVKSFIVLAPEEFLDGLSVRSRANHINNFTLVV